jgi:hypothetical protein
MSLDDFLEKFEEALDQCDRDEDVNVSIQVPPGTKCWENSWTQFEVNCISTDGTTIYLQCS